MRATQSSQYGSSSMTKYNKTFKYNPIPFTQTRIKKITRPAFPW